MSVRRVTSKDSLRALLEIVAEESVKSAYAKEASKEEAQKQAELVARLEKFKSAQPVEALEEEGEEQPEDGQQVQQRAQQHQQAPQQTQQSHLPPGPNIPQPAATFTQIKDKINSIRGGRSLRDREIREKLRDYFGDLDKEEREALHVFLDAISRILVAGIPSESAPEPNEEPHNIEMTKEEEEEADREENERHAQASAPQTPRQRRVARRGEDTTPPIDVGRRQRVESLRLHLRSLMD